MLGKLFGFFKDSQKKDSQKKDSQKNGSAPAPPPTAPSTPTAAKPQKPAGPSLLEQLTQGQPLDTITDSELLHQLVKHSDKLDKKTNRLVRERLQAIKEQEKQQLALHEKQEKLCVRMETLARLQHHPLYDSEFNHLWQQWQAIETPIAELAARVTVAADKCRLILQEAIALQQQQDALAKAAAEQAEQQAAQQRLRAEQQAAEQASQSQAQQIAQQQQQQQQQQSQADREQHQRQQQEISQALGQQLAQLEQAIDNADSKKARDLHDKARDNLKKLDQKHVHAFDGKLHLLSGQLRDLQDWQAFAALPKLEALCGEMDKLVDIDLPPLQKADSVRELQNQWRAMKPPTGKQAQALWDRFKQASDRAWEPCAAYFEKEKQHRAFNLQQRQAICEALEQFHAAQDWTSADWKAVVRILDKAKQEFHDFHPVERSEEKGIRTRFDAALGAINRQLLAEQQANEEKKRQLVEAASSVAAMTDLDKAAERVRQLQEQWKQVGITRRHEDQKLWQQLQEQTTIVFDKRRASQQQQRQAQQDITEQAKSLCEQIAALAKLPDSELAQSGAEFDRLQADYKTALAEIPEKAQASLKKAFYTACDSYRHQLSGISQRQHSLQLQELARRASLCSQLEHGSLDNDSVQAQWQQQTLPADWERAIEQRRQRAGQPQDHASNEQHLRELCIALEILLDRDTPEEDRQQRRDYQLRRLQQGLGQAATGQRREQLEQLLVQWYCASPAAPAVQAALQARFDAAQNAAGKAAG